MFAGCISQVINISTVAIKVPDPEDIQIGDNMPEEFPYNLPIWRRSYLSESPDRKFIAEINPAHEVSMGNPTYGTLIMSNGINLETCNPSFVWSDDSKYLAIPQYSSHWFFKVGKQRLLIIDIDKQQVWQSAKIAHYIQPEKFENGKLEVTLNPFDEATTVVYHIPRDMDKFTEKIPPPNNSLRPIGHKE